MKSVVIIAGNSKNRDGIEDDKTAITKTFSKTFGSEVIDLVDKSDSELKQQIKDFKTNEDWLTKFQECRFVVIFCLFHGSSDGQVYIPSADRSNYGELRNINRSFLNPFFKIKQLDGKLKWLNVQMCRGNLNDLVKSFSYETDGDENAPSLEYYLIYRCTGEGTYSAQANTEGKIFIQILCQEVENGKTETLLNMLKKVNNAFEEYGRVNKYENFSRPVFERNFSDDYKLME